MAPMLRESLFPSLEKTGSSKDTSCSDPSVLPSEHASERTKELWSLHGHPHSKRYSDPKLVSLAALVRYDGSKYKSKCGFLYPASTLPSTVYTPLTWDSFDRVTEAIALLYAQQLEHELSEANVTQVQPTVALLGGGKSIEYFCTQLALQKLGVRVLLLAESNSSSAIHSLLDACNAQTVIADQKNMGADTDGIRKIKMVDVLPLDLRINSAQVDLLKFQDFGDVWERHSFIIHSSGSTGMAKPIIHTNRSMMLIARMYRLFQEFSVENWFLLFPLYHIAGISIALSSLANGQLLSFPPLSWPPSSSSIFAAWRTLASMGYPVDCVHCAPTLIENMYEYILDNGLDFEPLASLKILQPGGAALSERIVEALVANGVNVKTTYGSTEIGPPFRTIPSTKDNPKCYTFRNLYPNNPFIKMEPVEGNSFECVVYKGFELAAELWNEDSENDCYRTNDLFIEEPPGSGFFSLQGRRDDILVHSNGENTSAGPLQLDIQMSSKLIEKVLAVGHSRPCVGLLIELRNSFWESGGFTLDVIWDIIKEVNCQYPSQSQVMKHMIYLLPAGKELPVTPKGNVRRKEAENTYASEIEQLYSDRFLSRTNSPTSFQSSSADAQQLAEFLRDLFASLSNFRQTEIHDWTTLYDLGIDSRLALSLRSSLSSHLSRSISLSTIFENPSISQLVSILEPLSPVSSIVSAETENSRNMTVNRIIQKLESEFKAWPRRSISNASDQASHETILLTGASGSLGTALLETLSASDKVEKIYAMVRGPKNLDKLRKALRKRGMDTSILDSGSKVKVLDFCMQDPLLGLDIDTYFHLAKTVTIVAQNAWKMDFNLPVEGFKSDCIRNTMNLLRFCYTGRPKTFAFSSSISTCMGTGFDSPVVSETPIGKDPAAALPTGYAQSKYIIERITQTACTDLDIPIKLLRLGQLCGSTKSGFWNTDEMWPIMFATSLHGSMRAIPNFPCKTIDWVPVDVAACTVADIMLNAPVPPSTSSMQIEAETKAESKTPAAAAYKVYNIVNPTPIPWQSLITMLQSIVAATTSPSPNSTSTSATDTAATEPLKLQELTMSQWVHRLNSLADKGLFPDELPGLRLLHFFENMAEGEQDDDAATATAAGEGAGAGGEGSDASGGGSSHKARSGRASKIFDTTQTRAISESLRNLGPFHEEWIARNFEVWREIGFLGR